MTANQLSEIIGTLLGYNDADKKINQRDCWFVADQVRGTAIPAYIEKYGKTVLGQFVYPIIFDVKYDAVRNRNYIEFGTQLLGGDYNSGIASVSLPQEEDDCFVMTSAGLTSVYAGLEAGLATGKKKCWIEGTRMYFLYLEPQQTKILVKGIPSLFELEDLDVQIPQPLEFNNILIEQTRAMFEEQKMTPENLTNDRKSAQA